MGRIIKGYFHLFNEEHEFRQDGINISRQKRNHTLLIHSINMLSIGKEGWHRKYTYFFYSMKYVAYYRHINVSSRVFRFN